MRRGGRMVPSMPEPAPILPYASTATRITAGEVVLVPPPPAWEMGLLALAGFFSLLGMLVSAATAVKNSLDRRPEPVAVVVGYVCFLVGGYGVFYFVRAILRRWRWGHLPARLWRSDRWLIVDSPGQFGPSPRRYLRAVINDVTVDRAGWSTDLRRLYRLRLRSGPRVRVTVAFTLGSAEEAGDVRDRVSELLRSPPDENSPAGP
jgi:hypothetical protein